MTSELDGCEIDSTLEMLGKVDCLNEKLSNKTAQSMVDDCGLTDIPDALPVDCSVKRIEDGLKLPGKNKGDIRSYGSKGSKTKVDCPVKNKSNLRDRIEKLRKSRSPLLPDIKDRMTAGMLIDKLEGSETIGLPDCKETLKCLGVKQKLNEMCILGSDVVSLFPSLKGVETARLTRHAILKSDIEFGNVDYHMALRYLSIIGGNELLNKAGLGRLSPVWLGDRHDLTTVGGRKSKDKKSWKDTTKDILEVEKRKIVAYMMESMVNVVMGSHVYSF